MGARVRARRAKRGLSLEARPSPEHYRPPIPHRRQTSCVAAGGASRDWTEERLARLARQGKRLERLVSQLLDVTRMTAGRLELVLEPVELASVVRDVQLRFTEAGEAARAG